MTARIRTASASDRDAIRALCLAAFPVEEGEQVATVACSLLEEATTPETLALVAEVGGEAVGHVAFSPVTADTGARWLGYILAPLAVEPGYQKRGIGTRLVETGIARLKDRGTDMVFVYGDPAYYGKFGFSAETADGFVPPYPLQYPFGWQAVALNATDTGDRAVRLSCVASLSDPMLW